MAAEPRRGPGHFRLGSYSPVAWRASSHRTGNAARFPIQRKRCRRGGGRSSFFRLVCQEDTIRRREARYAHNSYLRGDPVTLFVGWRFQLGDPSIPPPNINITSHSYSNTGEKTCRLETV